MFFGHQESALYSCQDQFGLISVQGKDAKGFLQRQLTNDITRLEHSTEPLLSCVLDQVGKVESWFQVIDYHENHYLLLTPKRLLEKTIERLDKYIIIEDIELKLWKENFLLLSGIQAATYLKNLSPSEVFLATNQYLQPSILCLFEKWNEEISKGIAPLNNRDNQVYHCLQGTNHLNDDNLAKSIVNNTLLFDRAVCLNKGCFLGFETVSKIDSNRGASYFPVLLSSDKNIEITREKTPLLLNQKKIGSLSGSACEVNGRTYMEAMLIRDYRVDQSELTLTIDGVSNHFRVHIYPTETSTIDWLKEHLYQATDLYVQAGDFSRAKERYQNLIAWKQDELDFYEGLGVMLGREEYFQEAIDLFHRIEEQFPEAQMIDTNLSLNYMKIGEIDKAEHYQAQATVKAFKIQGDLAAKDKASKEQYEQEFAERERRKGMFTQVLELDEKDDMANYGLAEIYYFEKKLALSLKHLDIVIKEHPKYSQAYQLKASILLEQNKIGEAREILIIGKDIAAKKGEMMPANKMQAMLNQLPS
jgi:folate-binding Fe-S cluster repair protein YgfZ/Tfp pilus assembly protein PilF